MVYALINSGIVENTIVSDENFIYSISSNWQYCVRIDQLDPIPGIGWTYDGSTFAPQEITPPVEE